MMKWVISSESDVDRCLIEFDEFGSPTGNYRIERIDGTVSEHDAAGGTTATGSLPPRRRGVVGYAAAGAVGGIVVAAVEVLRHVI